MLCCGISLFDRADHHAGNRGPDTVLIDFFNCSSKTKVIMSKPPLFPEQTASGIAVDPRTLDRVVPESRRADGSYATCHIFFTSSTHRLIDGSADPPPFPPSQCAQRA